MQKLLILLTLASFFSYASETKPPEPRCNKNSNDVECGWHFGYIDPLGDLVTKQEDDSPEQKIIINIPPKESEPEEKCTNKSNWSESCGFVDPGTDFEFQAMQRDIFLQNLLMKSGDPQSVENMQRYQKWLVSKAVEASKVWEYNLVQKPELSASVKNPVSSFGLSVATRLREDTNEAVLREIKDEQGTFVWFTRSDCSFCITQRPLLLRLEKNLDLNIRNVSLDENCMRGFEEDCIKAPESTIPSQVIGVDIVPSVYLFMPKDETWIRISNGLESQSTIMSRIRNFFLAIKSAHLNGITNSDSKTRPSVDFKNSTNLEFQGIREIKD